MNENIPMRCPACGYTSSVHVLDAPHMTCGDCPEYVALEYADPTASPAPSASEEP